MPSLTKFIRRTGICIALGFLWVSPSYADEASSAAMNALLQQILDTTKSILIQVQQIPVYIKSITEMADSWLNTKDNDIIANDQYSFALLNKNYADSIPQQSGVAKNLVQQFFLSGSNNKSGATTLPYNANELSYSSLLGQPLTPPSASGTTSPQQQIDALAQSYIKNASGLNLPLKQANPLWRDSDAKKQYQQMYNAVSSVASYDAFILSGLYKQQDQNTIRTNLLDQASSSDWFKAVASESLGLVLRQMLMYTSQVYVQLDRLVKVQQQQLTAQAMTNTLLITYLSTTPTQTLTQQAQMAR